MNQMWKNKKNRERLLGVCYCIGTAGVLIGAIMKITYHKNGQLVFLISFIFGSLVGVIGSFWDIKEQKQLKNEVEKLKEENNLLKLKK